MEVGSFGDVVFEVSESEVRTFTELTQKRSARYSTLNVANGEQLLQYAGKELQRVSISITLHHRFADPAAELTVLGEMVEEHKAHLLIVGGYKLGEFVLKDMDASLKRVAAGGVIMLADVRLDLQEYK